MPPEQKFNRIAAKDGKLYQLIKDGQFPFYVDRIAGGITYHEYDYDHRLIESYSELLGKWFLGFQLHESGSNRRGSDWGRILKLMGTKGPYDAAALRKLLARSYAKMPDGTVLLCVGATRVVDVAEVLKAAAYRGKGSVDLRIHDDICSWNDKCYHVEFDQVCTELRESTECDAEMDIRSFTSLILGCRMLEDCVYRQDVRVYGNRDNLDKVFYRKAAWIEESF